jgi:hypothetical protein
VVQADIINGNFDNGLIGWTTEGDVSVVNGMAVLDTAESEFGALISLNQQTGVIPGFSVLSFDFGFSGGNPTPPPETFPDFLQISFFDSISDAPELNPGFVAIDPLGIYDLNPIGTLTPILNSNLLYHFSMDISGLAGREGVLYFDLSNQDDAFDSKAYVDNVTITATVPEPATLLLQVSGLAGVLAFAKRRLLLTRR